MNKTTSLIFKILGGVLITIGIVITIIPLFNFDGQTFKLIPALLSGLAMPLVGMSMIIITIIIDTNNASNDEIDQISSKARKEITKSNLEKSKSASNTCKYCGCKNKIDATTCKNCGAKISK